MKKMKTTWRWVLAAACTLLACGDSDGDSTPGGSATAGSGAGVAGAAGASGGSGTGGKNAGGAAIKAECDGSKKSTPAATCDFPAGNQSACHSCLEEKCCDLVKACFGTNPGNQCGYGGPGGESEIDAYQKCLASKVKANGSYSPEDEDACAESTSTAMCAGILGIDTQDLIGCMHTNCEKTCIEDPEGGSTGGAAGVGGEGGSSSGGAGAGGKNEGGAGAGGKNTGGAPVAVECDTDQVKGMPAATCDAPIGGQSPCNTCLKENCCEEVKSCFGTNPGNQCGFGGPGGESEIAAYEQCLIEKTKANGFYSQAEMEACAVSSATPTCDLKIIGTATSNLASCMHNNCEKACIEDPSM